MKHTMDLLTKGNIRKSFTGAPVPMGGYAVRLNSTIETISCDISLPEVEEAIEDYKTRHFDDLNQMGAFYDASVNEDNTIITMSVVVYIEDKQQAIKYNHELN